MLDLHAHVVLEGTLGAAGPYGPELRDADPATGGAPCFRVGDYELNGVRYRGTPFMDVELRIAAMDRLGIEQQMLSPNPLTYFGRADADWAAAFCRRHNDELARTIASAPERLLGAAQLPMQDPAAAAAELARSIGELGLVAAYIGTDLDRPLDDPAFDVVWSACVDLDVPVFLHPSVEGIEAPRRDDRRTRFDADLWIGFCYEETLAVATLVLGGVLARHPELDCCISHGGGATAMLAERMAHAARTRPWADDAIAAAGAVEALLARLWWDAHVGGPKALANLVTMFGTDRVVAGTNLAGWDSSPDPSHGNDDLAATFTANARRLLRLTT